MNLQKVIPDVEPLQKSVSVNNTFFLDVRDTNYLYVTVWTKDFASEEFVGRGCVRLAGRRTVLREPFRVSLALRDGVPLRQPFEEEVSGRSFPEGAVVGERGQQDAGSSTEGTAVADGGKNIAQEGKNEAARTGEEGSSSRDGGKGESQERERDRSSGRGTREATRRSRGSSSRHSSSRRSKARNEKHSSSRKDGSEHDASERDGRSKSSSSQRKSRSSAKKRKKDSAQKDAEDTSTQKSATQKSASNKPWTAEEVRNAYGQNAGTVELELKFLDAWEDPEAVARLNEWLLPSRREQYYDAKRPQGTKLFRLVDAFAGGGSGTGVAPLG